MNRFISLLIACVIVGGAWIWTFGPPLGGDTATSDPTTPATAGPGRPGGMGATLVTLAEVTQDPYVETFRSIGTAKARANVNVNVTSEVSGRVTAVHFTDTAEVAAGDTLVSLNPQVEEIARSTARANLDEAQSTLDRLSQLQRSGSAAVTAVSVTEAETQVALATANLARAEYDLSQKTIQAPISGVLDLSDIEVGAYLTANSPVVRIMDQSQLRIEFGLPDRASSFVNLGQVARLVTTSLPGQIFEAEVTGFDGLIDSTTQTIKVRATIDNPEGKLLPGMIFSVSIAQPNEALPKLPAAALTWTRDGASVWRVDGGSDGTMVTRVPITLRHRANDMVWVEAELPAGSKVVVEGVQKLREGGQVTTADQAMARRPAAEGSN